MLERGDPRGIENEEELLDGALEYFLDYNDSEAVYQSVEEEEVLPTGNIA